MARPLLAQKGLCIFQFGHKPATAINVTGQRAGMATSEQIRQILAESGRLAVPVENLAEDADLFAAGLDSLAIVNVLMSIEEQFEIELPDELLSRRSFSTIATITRVVSDLTEQTVAP